MCCRHTCRLLILLALVVVGYGAPQEGQDPAGIIRGFVKSSGSGTRLADVQITLAYPRIANESPISRKTATDADGRFEFRDVPVGAHQLTGEREGLFGLGSARVVRANLSLTTNQLVQEVVLEMVQGGAIRGRVVDSEGKPIVGLVVRPFRAAYQDGKRRLFTTGVNPRVAMTDTRGEYRVFWTSPGEYYLFTDLPPSEVSRGFRGFYYPGVLDADSAVAVKIGEGEESTGIDIKLPVVKRYSIGGLFSLPTNISPSARIREIVVVRRDARLRDADDLSFPNERASEGTGPFRISGIAPGSYDLYPVLRDSTLGTHTARMPVEVKDSDVNDIVGTILPNTAVKVRVALKGGAANPAGQGLILQLRPDVLVVGAMGNISAPLLLEGDLTLPGAPRGLYHVRVSGALPGFYLADIRQGARSIYETAAIELDGKGSDPIELTFSMGGGAIRGSAPAGATILMIPSDNRRANYSLRRRLGVGASGQFAANDVAPGEYRLFAFEAGALTPSEEESPEFLYRYETRARSIAVRPGITLTDIKLDVLR